MTIDLSNSAQLFCCVLIYPHSSDDWTSSPPFVGVSLNSKTAYALGTLPSDSFSTLTKVSGKLIDIGEINRSIDIFSKGKQADGEHKISGVGGVAKTDDVDITLHNADDTVDVVKLFGRKVEIVIGTGTTMSEATDTVFTGKINSVQPSRKELVLTCRGFFSVWMDKEIGKVTNFNSDTYRAKIYPITYGDFSDDNGYMPIVPDNDMFKIPNLYLGDQKINELSSLRCWDEDGKIDYIANKDNDIQISANKNMVELLASVGSYLVTDVEYYDRQISIWNPPAVAFELDPTSADAVAVSPLDAHTLATSGSVYRNSTDTARYEYLEEEGGYYKFTCADVHHLPAISGTLTKISGDGPATLDYDWRSQIVAESIVIEHIETDPWYVKGSPASTDVASVAKPSPCFVKINSEIMFAYSMSAGVDSNNLYNGHVFYVCRGQKETFTTDHSCADTVYKIDSQLSAAKWLVKHRFYVKDFSDFHASYDDNEAFGEPEVQGTLVSNLNVTLESTTHNKLLRVHTDGNGHANGEHSFFNFVMHFPPIGLSGEIKDVFVGGEYSVVTTGATGDDYEVHNSLCIAVGGIRIPWFVYKSAGPGHMTGVGFYKKVPSDFSEFNFHSSLYAANGWATGLKFLCFDHWDGSTRRKYDTFNTLDAYGDTIEEDSFSLMHPEYPNTQFHAGLFNVNQLNDKRISLVWGVRSKLSGSAHYHLFWMQTRNPYLFVHFYVDPLKTPWWAKGKGREFDPDGFTYFNEAESGLIENPADVIEDIARRELGLIDSELDDTWFNWVRFVRANWKVAFSLFEKPEKTYDLFDSIAKQFGIAVVETPDGMLSLKSLSLPESTSGYTDIDDSHIKRDSNNMIIWSEEYTPIDHIVTDVVGKYQIRYPDGIFTQVRKTEGDPPFEGIFENADIILDAEKVVTVEADKIRAENTMSELLYLIGDYYADPKRILTLECTLFPYGVAVGQWITCSSSHITGVSGKMYLVIENSIQLPVMGEDAGCILKMIEFSEEEIGDGVQEVAVDSGVGDQWQEVEEDGATDTYQETI